MPIPAEGGATVSPPSAETTQFRPHSSKASSLDGDTFTVGDAPKQQACADAARALFDEVAAEWRANGTSGRDLYAFAARRAEAMDWRLNHDIKGHRLGDFPHAIHKGGDLGDFASMPAPGLWVLEIQIAHPSEPFGAFYEDLLLDPAPAG